MDWERERYVRAYKRDTPEWVALDWQARALFWEVLRKTDIAGRLNMGKAGLRGVAILIHWPVDVVGQFMPQLLEDGCIVQEGTVLVVRNYVAAQESKASPGARQSAWRERKRIGPPGNATSTVGNATSTVGNAASLDVDASGRPVDSKPSLTQAIPKPSSAVSAREAPPAAAPQPPHASEILTALEAHESLRPVATEIFARALAKQFGADAIAKGTKLEWVIAAIAEAALTVAGTEGMLAREAAKTVQSYVRNARAPKPEPRSGPIRVQPAVSEPCWKPAQILTDADFVTGAKQ